MLLSHANYHVACYCWLVLATNLITTMEASFLLFSLVTRWFSSTRGVIPSSDFWLKWDTPSEHLHTLGLFLDAGWVWFFSVHNAAESSASAVFAGAVIDTCSSLACEVFLGLKSFMSVQTVMDWAAVRRPRIARWRLAAITDPCGLTPALCEQVPQWSVTEIAQILGQYQFLCDQKWPASVQKAQRYWSAPPIEVTSSVHE